MHKYLNQNAYVKDENGVTLLHGKITMIFENPLTGELEIKVWGQIDRAVKPIPSMRDNDISRVVE